MILRECSALKNPDQLKIWSLRESKKMSPVCGSFLHEYLSDIKDAKAGKRDELLRPPK